MRGVFMNTLTDQISGAAVTLPRGLIWRDEFDWSPVETTRTYSLTGALIIEQAARLSGRPVTLAAADDTNWAQRSTVETLRQWAAMPARVFTLALAGQSRTVLFDEEGVTARPVLDIPQRADGDFYHIALKFIEVSA